MASDPHTRIKEVAAQLTEQREKLRRLHKEYYREYDAAFDEYGAGASIERWLDRTLSILRENLGNAEAARFQRSVPVTPRGRDSWAWGDVCKFLDTYLDRLIDDMLDYPDDPKFHEAAKIAPPKTPGSREIVLTFDVFLSYSSLEQEEARAIHDVLTDAGKTCFLAPMNLNPGDNFPEEIRSALEASREIWVLVSQNSLKSPWVQTEASAAWGMKKRIVPILFRCGPNDLPHYLADKQAIDYHKVSAYISKMK